ncbi:MAG: hypothetical protein B5M51_06750 [Anaerolinea sp. 4484_236]|nr:MAG: hypothetical protein B5M51_06750 [Anaerolinea sp. 4484_236]
MIWARFISIEALQRVAYCVLRVAWTLPNERRNTKHVVLAVSHRRARGTNGVVAQLGRHKALPLPRIIEMILRKLSKVQTKSLPDSSVVLYNVQHVKHNRCIEFFFRML